MEAEACSPQRIHQRIVRACIAAVARKRESRSRRHLCHWHTRSEATESPDGADESIAMLGARWAGDSSVDPQPTYRATTSPIALRAPTLHQTADTFTDQPLIWHRCLTDHSDRRKHRKLHTTIACPCCA